MRRLLVILPAAALLTVMGWRAGITLAITLPWSVYPNTQRHKTVLRVWDWWAPATSEKYAAYFDAVKRDFEAVHPNVEIELQYVPFEQYEQKMATALVGNSPPDVFQASVSWAEGFYD